jgi:hypothetical protein
MRREAVQLVRDGARMRWVTIGGREMNRVADGAGTHRDDLCFYSRCNSSPHCIG